MPNPSDMTAGSQVYVDVSVKDLSIGNSLDSPDDRIDIYSQSASITIVLKDAQFCPGEPDSPVHGFATQYDFYRYDANESSSTTYLGGPSFRAGDYQGQTYSSTNPRSSDCKDISITLSGGVKSNKHPGYYAFTMEAYAIDGTGSGVNAFKVVGPLGSKITYTPKSPTAKSGAGPKFSLQDRNSSGSTDSNFTLRFSPSCQAKTGDVAYLTWYDADWGTLETSADNFGWKLYDLGPKNDNFASPQLIAKNINNTPSYTGVFPTSGVPGTASGPTDIGSSGDLRRLGFVVKENHQYIWVWQGVAKSNGIQFQLPYGSIEYYTGMCQYNNPVGNITVKCPGAGGILTSAKDPDDGVHQVAGDGKAVQVEVLAGGNTDTNNPDFGPAWANNDEGGTYPNYYRFDGSSWKNYVDSNSSNTSVNLALYAQDNETGKWIRVDTATFDATKCAPPACASIIAPSGFIEPGSSFTFQVQATSNAALDSGDQFHVSGDFGSFTRGFTQSGTTATSTASSSVTPVSAKNYTVNWYLADSSGTKLTADCSGTISVVNLPYFKVFGSGMEAGGAFAPGCTNGATTAGNGGYQGSIGGWFNNGTPINSGNANTGAGAQFNATSLGKIIGAGSGTGGVTSTSPPLAGANNFGLTFANTGTGVDTTSGSSPSPAMGGNLGGSQCLYGGFTMPSGVALSSPATVGSDINPPASSNDATYTYTGNLQINAGQLQSPKHASVYVDGNVFISASSSPLLNYATGWQYNNAQGFKLPSFRLFVTGNIYIDPNITELDGIYVAEGKIFTCGQSNFTPVDKAALSGCNQPLLINGVFSATQVNLMRTRGTLKNATGSETSGANNAAETFEYSPELFLTTPPGPTGSGDYDSFVALPPVL